MKLGIDLGTSNSSVAIFDRLNGSVTNIKVSTGNEPYDSILRSCALFKGKDIILGARAEREYGANRNNDFITSFKPYLNETHLRKKTIVKKESVIVGYDDHWQQPIWREIEDIEYVGARFSKDELMQSLCAFLGDMFGKCQRDVRQRGESCDGYLVGIPLNAKMYYRLRLLEALKNASPFMETYQSILKNTTFIPEPVAVSFCFMDRIKPEDKRVLIFDFGGGTLDVALLFYENVNGHMLPTELLGLSCLDKAGNYIDQTLKEYLFEKYSGYRKIFEKMDPMSQYFEGAQIEKIKIELSKTDSMKDKLTSGQKVEISRLEFKNVLSALLNEIDACVKRCLEQANLDYTDIDRVIMAGGSSLIPAVQERLAELFGRKKLIAQNPIKNKDTEVALTGVSRGLACYEYFIEMSGLQPYKYHLWNQKNHSFTTVLDRNARAGAAAYDPRLDGYGAGSLCLYYNMIAEEPLLAITGISIDRDIPWTVEITQDNVFGTLPVIKMRNAEGKSVLKLDLTKLKEATAKKMIQNCDWRLRASMVSAWEVPSVPIEIGNRIRVRGSNKVYEVTGEEKGSAKCLYQKSCEKEGKPHQCKDKTCVKGTIQYEKTGIRDIEKGRYVKITESWDLSKYSMKLIDTNHRTSVLKDSFKSHEIEIAS